VEGEPKTRSPRVRRAHRRGVGEALFRPERKLRKLEVPAGYLHREKKHRKKGNGSRKHIKKGGTKGIKPPKKNREKKVHNEGQVGRGKGTRPGEVKGRACETRTPSTWIAENRESTTWKGKRGLREKNKVEIRPKKKKGSATGGEKKKEAIGSKRRTGQ